MYFALLILFIFYAIFGLNDFLFAPSDFSS